MATTAAARRLAHEVMGRLVVPPDLFLRTEGYQRGMMRRGNWVENRARVWWEMRKPHPTTGIVLSYPEIAGATTGRGHSSIREALRKWAPIFEAQEREHLAREAARLAREAREAMDRMEAERIAAGGRPRAKAKAA